MWSDWHGPGAPAARFRDSSATTLGAPWVGGGLGWDQEEAYRRKDAQPPGTPATSSPWPRRSSVAVRRLLVARQAVRPSGPRDVARLAGVDLDPLADVDEQRYLDDRA